MSSSDKSVGDGVKGGGGSIKVAVPKSGDGSGKSNASTRWQAPRGRAEDPSPAALLLEGTQAKERGNQLFRKNEHRAAIRLYKQAILSTRGLYSRTRAMAIFAEHLAQAPGKLSKSGKGAGSRRPRAVRLSTEEEAQLRQLTQSLHANLSACYLKLDDWEKAVRYAAVVLESDPGNVKSMLRLGQAYHMLGDLLGADRILTKAAALHQAKDALGKALRETLRVVRAKMRSKERRMAQGQGQGQGQGPGAAVGPGQGQGPVGPLEGGGGAVSQVQGQEQGQGQGLDPAMMADARARFEVTNAQAQAVIASFASSRKQGEDGEGGAGDAQEGGGGGLSVAAVPLQATPAVSGSGSSAAGAEPAESGDADEAVDVGGL